MTHPTLARQILRTVFVTADRLGATMPPAIKAEHQRLLTAAERSREMYQRLSGDVAGAVVAALELDRDPLTDGAVRDALTARQILGVQRGIDDAIAARTQELLFEHGSAIVTSFRKPFDQAAAAIVNAVETLGNIEIDNMSAVLARGGTAAKLWAEAKQAGDTITQIKQMWKLLSSAATHLAVNPRYRLLIIADVPAKTFVDEQLGSVNLSAWDAVRRGFTLSLATPETLQERIAAVTAELQQRKVQAEGAFTKRYRQTHGMGAPA